MGDVFDGVKDCSDGDDEDECMSASLFRKESGYKLEGVTAGSESDSIQATEEQCAKMCLYKKQDASDCCNSFSHVLAREGKMADVFLELFMPTKYSTV